MRIASSSLALTCADTPLQACRRVLFGLKRLLLACMASLLTLMPCLAMAQAYPDKGRPIRIIVPSGAGSALDLLARSYGKTMAETLGLSVIVDNKPGADGTIGIQAFSTTPTDGYTMLLLSSSWTVLAPIINPKVPYDPIKDFVPLVTTSRAGIVMSTSSNSPFKNLREFVAAARANPGKFSCATASPTLRLACEHLQASAGIKMLIVPYKTTASATLAVASGETDVIFADAGSFMSLWHAGRLKPVAFATQERTSSFPNVPTMREEGLSDFLMSAWYGIYFKAGTPPAIEATMREILRKTAHSNSVKEALKTFVHDPMDLAGPDITALTQSESEKWSRMVRERGIKFTD